MTDRSQYPVQLTSLAGYDRPPRIADPAEAIACMWQLTVDAWAMRGENVADFRMPRHVVRLIRGGDQALTD